MPTAIQEFSASLRTHAGDFDVQLDDDVTARLARYYELLLKWNPRLHLVAPCSPAEFAERHILESLFLLSHLPSNARLVDIGSGAGLPIIPCLLRRPDLRGTLIESSSKKSVFLQEALRDLESEEPPRVITARFEETPPPEADFVTCRGLDRFSELLPRIVDWSPPRSTLLLFGGEAITKEVEALLPWAHVERIPRSERRFLIVAPRQNPDHDASL